MALTAALSTVGPDEFVLATDFIEILLAAGSGGILRDAAKSEEQIEV